jgi:hypothetical protein
VTLKAALDSLELDCSKACPDFRFDAWQDERRHVAVVENGSGAYDLTQLGYPSRSMRSGTEHHRDSPQSAGDPTGVQSARRRPCDSRLRDTALKRNDHRRRSNQEIPQNRPGPRARKFTIWGSARGDVYGQMEAVR